jgi:hypothetical protein
MKTTLSDTTTSMVGVRPSSAGRVGSNNIRPNEASERVSGSSHTARAVARGVTHVVLLGHVPFRPKIEAVLYVSPGRPSGRVTRRRLLVP